MRMLITAFAVAIGISSTWAAPLPPNQTLNDAAFGNTIFVSVGANGTIYSSVNSGPWELRASGTTNHLQAVAFGNGTFVAAGTNGTLLRSPNGVDWISVAGGAPNVPWSNPDIAYGNGMFVLGAKGAGSAWTMLASSDGTVWTSVDVDAPGVEGRPLPFGGVAFGEGRFLAVGGQFGANLVVTSTNGLLWREQGADMPRAASTTQGPITYGNGKFAMVVNSSSSDDDDDGGSYIDHVLFSDDGTRWQNSSLGAGDIPAIAGADCTFVAAIAHAQQPIWYNHGTFRWTNPAMAEGVSVKAIAYGNGRFVAFGSDIVELPVPPPGASITLYPESQELPEGTYAYLWFDPPMCVETPITYQWRRDGVPIPGATSSYLQLSIVTTNDTGDYTVVGTNSAGLSITSSVARLVVTSYIREDFPPQIGWHTTNLVVTMAEGSDQYLSFGLDGWPFPSFQWYFNGSAIPGETNAYLGFLDVDARAEGAYTVVASNYLGSATNPIITISVYQAAPAMRPATMTRDVLEGEPVSFYLPELSFAGAPEGDIYILHNGTNTPLVLSSFVQFSLREVSMADAGEYSVVASNALGVSTGLVATLNVLPAGRLDRWTRRNPLPQSDPLLEVAHGNGRFVAVGERSAVVVSTNGVDWSSHPLKPDLALRGIAFGHGIFAAIAGGAILSSSDGAAWDIRVNRMEGFQNVAFGNGRFVAANGNDVLTSTDGVRWEEATFPIHAPRSFRAIAFGNGIFVGLAGYSESPVWISSDGVNWSSAGDTFSYSIEDLAFGNGLFVAVGEDGIVYTSPDGVNWTFRDSDVSNRLIDVAYGNGRFVVVGTRGRIISSGNGTTWRRETSGTPDRLEGVTFGGGQFIAVGENGTILSSANGSTWTKRNYGVTRDLDGMALGNGTIVVVGKGGSVMTSSDGTNYIERASGTVNDLHGVGWGGNLFVAVGEPETIVTSPDGVEWTVRHLGTNSALKAVTKANGTWIAVGTGGAILTSSDAITWTRRESFTLHDLNSVSYGNGLFVVVGDNLPPNGTLLTSVDGTSWSRRNQYIGKNLRTVTFANDSFLAGANDGWLLASSNGMNWPFVQSSIAGGYNFNLRGIAYANNQWVIVGNQGLVLTSPDGRNWLARSRQGMDNLHAVVGLNNTFVAIGNRGTILQSEYFDTVGPTLEVRAVNQGVEITAVGEAGSAVTFEAGPSLTGPWQQINSYFFRTGFTNITFFDLTPTDGNRRFYRALSR